MKMGIGVVFIVTAMIACDRPPELTSEEFEAARGRWEQQAYADYTVVVRKDLDGQASERIKTVVERHAVKSLEINDRELAIVESYTIDGLFEIIERELEMLGAKEKQPGQPAGAKLSARFDPATGIPTTFNRVATNGKSFFLSVEAVEVPGRGVVFP